MNLAMNLYHGYTYDICSAKIEHFTKATILMIGNAVKLLITLSTCSTIFMRFSMKLTIAQKRRRALVLQLFLV
ncbi:MAG: hypothetical protein PHN18_01950 [Sulfurospirillaceae bacterium]|nr:hypothetical protein [Sulfurospirillaceae bacterium]MDD2826554.1 hypothetical protein [Sulfurospirillaceae bacterium]